MSYTYARAEGNVAAAASTVMIAEVFKGIPADAGARILASLKDVTLEDVKYALETYWKPLFSSETSVVAVACAESLADKISEQFSTAGFAVERRQLQSSEEDDDDASMTGSYTGSEGESGTMDGSDAMSTGS